MSPGLRTLELLSIAILIGGSAAIAVPKYETSQRAGVAAAMLDDVEHLRKAVYAFYSDSAYFPQEVDGGELPDALTEYLPRGFSTRRAYGTLAYRNWPVRMLDTGTVAIDSTRVSARDTLASAPDALVQPNDSTPDGGLDSLASAAADSARQLVESLAREAAAAAPPREALRSNVIAVVVTPNDTRIAEIAYRRVRDLGRFVVGDRYAFVLFGG